MVDQQKIKVGYVLSYKDPNYVRTRYICKLISGSQKLQLLTAANSKKGILRYAQTFYRLMVLRLRYRPDVYVLGFRGHEVFWPVRLITIGKPLIFDEFLNAYDWAGTEHKSAINTIISKLVYANMYLMTRACAVVLTDTELHAARTRELYGLDKEKVQVLYVGTDEDVFSDIAKAKNGKKFRVLFYGTFLPLHGMDVILDAAKQTSNPNIEYRIIGGATKQEQLAEFKTKLKTMGLKNVSHDDWVEYKKLPEEIASAELCLGGPFGGTTQARRVITGKTFQFLSMAKPTVIGSIDEFVGFKDRDNCLVVEQGSSAQLAQAVDWAYNNRTKLGQIGKNGKKLYDKSFSLKAQRPVFEKIVQDVVE